ncbi:MAG: SagB/ThcOx family dehydrogenase [Pseudomonadota bacterium]
MSATDLEIRLPLPHLQGSVSVEQAIAHRRSRREFTAEPITLQQFSQLLWAAQGITDPQGLRAAPSAGALYPLEVYAVVGKITPLEPGVYRYRSKQHALEQTGNGDKRAALAYAAVGQLWIQDAPVSLVFSGIYERTTAKYRERGRRYVHTEAGHAGENVFLQAEALRLGTVVVGAFDDEAVARILQLDEREQPLVIMPIGRPKGE